MIDNYLWTPWRMQYITGASGEKSEDQPGAGDQGSEVSSTSPTPDPRSPISSSGCVFCDRLRLPLEHDRQSLILLRAPHNFVLLNLYPYNSGHLMVVPNEHTSDFANLNAETSNEMVALTQRMLRIIDAEYEPQGYNLGMNMGRIAGAGVADHVHMHVVPRWSGDTNFMPVVGSTKVMPELLETTYDRLKARLETIK